MTTERGRLSQPAAAVLIASSLAAAPALAQAAFTYSKQYVAVQSGWGVDAERGQRALDSIRGTTTQVPAGGVLWVFALP